MYVQTFRVRGKENKCLVSSYVSNIFRIGRLAKFIYIKTHLYRKSMKIFKKFYKRLEYPIRLLRSLSRPQNIRVCRVTGNTRLFSWP